MLSVVDLKFNNEKHFKKEKVIYHKGNVIGRPKTASRPLLIPRIKKVQIQHRTFYFRVYDEYRKGIRNRCWGKRKKL